MLEGGIFLIMGLELDQIVEDVLARHEGIVSPTLVALAALLIVLVVRAAYVAFLLWAGRKRARGTDRARFEEFDARLDSFAETGFPERRAPGGRVRPHPSPERVERRTGPMRRRVARALADIDYYQASPLG